MKTTTTTLADLVSEMADKMREVETMLAHAQELAKRAKAPQERELWSASYSFRTSRDHVLVARARMTEGGVR